MTERDKNYSYSSDNKIEYTTVKEFVVVIWQGKYLIFSFSFLFAVMGIFYSLSLANTYQSKVLLAPNSAEGGFELPGQLGGLAALAGVNLSNGGANSTSLAIEIVKSKKFLSTFIEKHELLVPLMAAKSWDLSTNILLLDEDVYNFETSSWVREVDPPLTVKPSSLEANEAFNEIMSISTNEDTGFITLSIEFYSPFLAKVWIDFLVEDLNETMRERELKDAESSIAFLTGQLEKTSLSDVKEMLFSLIEEQTKTLMLANVRKEFMFETIDPAYNPEEKASPARAIIVILLTFIGAIMATIFLLLKEYILNKKTD
jgi:LPS O-antigen subunit length determinant protein (WzzB/FepE family)